MKHIRITILILIILSNLPIRNYAQWWQTEAIRVIQTNLRENSEIDPDSFINGVQNLNANALLINVGGIMAFYPSKLPYQHVIPNYSDVDKLGELIEKAHANNIKIIGRFDFSLASKAAFDAHPEWFVKDEMGLPVRDSNGNYYTCMNGFYQHYAIDILKEALKKYPLDGVFINQFQNRTDRPGGGVLICHCENCKTRYHNLYGKELPDKMTDEFTQYRLINLRREIAGLYKRTIHEIRPGAAFMTYMTDSVDIVMAESRTYHPFEMPAWRYTASDNVNRVTNLKENKPVFSFCMSHVESFSRLSSIPGAEVQSRLYQAMANGGAPVLAMSGTFDQEDRSMLEAAKPVFDWHKKHSTIYLNQKNMGKVMLYTSKREHTGSNWSSANYRGFFKMLTELHIPFVVSHDVSLLNDREQFDLVIAPDGISETILPWLEKGGRLITSGTSAVVNFSPKTYKLHNNLKGAYFRVQKPDLFPSLKHTNVIFLEGNFLELLPDKQAPLTYITPSKYSPPEKVFTDAVQTTFPGLLFEEIGNGKHAYLPWDIGALYHRYGSDTHRSLLSDLVDIMLPGGRDIYTDAHPAVELTLMRQPGIDNLQVHLINNSGNSGMSFFPPVTMHSITFRIKGKYKKAIQLSNNKHIKLFKEGNYTRFTIAELANYEVILLK